MTTAFSQKDSIGSKNRRVIATYLREIGDDESAARFDGAGGAGQGLSFNFSSDPWAYTGMLLGYIPPNPAGAFLEIANAVTLEPDVSLKNTRLKITLDKFYVQKYPGGGTHSILCEFSGKNQISGDSEELRFAITTRSADRSSAAVSGAPIFLGASVGQNGISFEGRNVNVSSDRDEALVEALGSDAFKNGLGLLTSAQPALKPFVGLASSVVKSILSRSQNKQVFAFQLGLDFGGGSTSARLRHGSYIVVQADQASWNWNAVKWNAHSQSLVNAADGNSIPYNYMVFGVSPFL